MKPIIFISFLAKDEFFVDFWPSSKFAIECPENYLMVKIQVSLTNIFYYYPNNFTLQRRQIKRVHTIK